MAGRVAEDGPVMTADLATGAERSDWDQAVAGLLDSAGKRGIRLVVPEDGDWPLVLTRPLPTDGRIIAPVEPRNVNRRFERLRERAGLPWLRLHDLRHGCVTYLLAHGIDPRTVMEILGHTTIRQTMDRYAHALPERLRAAADTMDDALGSAP